MVSKPFTVEIFGIWAGHSSSIFILVAIIIKEV
jgi:hypothetical protein